MTRPYEVSEVYSVVNRLLTDSPELQNIDVIGEISNYSFQRASGHHYFTLKDARAQLKCTLFRSAAARVRFPLRNGLKVLVHGSVAAYAPQSTYQLNVRAMVEAGEGALRAEYERLKQQLADEGLFDPSHKKPLPRFPRIVGVITSATGMAVRDIYKVAKQRNPLVTLVTYPVAVQGSGAAQEMVAAVKFFNERRPVDVLIIGRGGGSVEDLWEFNSEALARAIFASRIPVISAVGHEGDNSISDYVADVRAATPSDAAELAVPDVAALARTVRGLKSQLVRFARHQITQKRVQVDRLQNSPLMARPAQFIDERRQRADQLQKRLIELVAQRLAEKRHRTELATERLALLDPIRMLRRGYGIVEKSDGGLVRGMKDMTVGDRLKIVMADGQAAVRVEKVER